MSDRASLLAGLGDILTEMCCFYVVAGRLIMNAESWGLSPAALFLPVIIALLLFALLLKKPRPVPVLTSLTVALIIATVTGWCLVSATPVRFGYVFLMLVGAGIAVGRALNVALYRVDMRKHLVHLDVLLIVLFALLLIRSSSVMDIPTETVTLALLILPLQIASAVALRMTEGGNADLRGAGKAALLSLAALAVVGLLVLGLDALFSGSGEVTGALLRGLGSFFKKIGKALEEFFRRLAELLATDEEYETIIIEEMGSVAELEKEALQDRRSYNLTPLYIALTALFAGGLAFVTVLLRKSKLRGASVGGETAAGAEHRADAGFLAELWRRWLAAARFRRECFRHRFTAEGVFLYLERRGKRRKKPRQEGETMRRYVERLDAKGCLTALVTALDERCYSPRPTELSRRDCVKLRRAVRRIK